MREEQEEDDEEVQIFMEVSEDTRGFRALVSNKSAPASEKICRHITCHLSRNLSQVEILS